MGRGRRHRATPRRGRHGLVAGGGEAAARGSPHPRARRRQRHPPVAAESRSTPKHLLPLAPGGETLLRATLERVIGLGDSVRVVTAADQADGCRAALVGLRTAGRRVSSRSRSLAGRARRSRSPSALIAREDPDALIASVHADHRVSDPDAYRAAVLASAGWAAGDRRSRDRRARPGGPGHRLRLHRGRRAPRPGVLAVPAEASPPGGGRGGGACCRPLSRPGFKEKPSAEVAQAYVGGGRHLWNLGLFAWTARRFLAELQRLPTLRSLAIGRGRRRAPPGRRGGGDAALRGTALSGRRTARPRADAAPHRRPRHRSAGPTWGRGPTSARPAWRTATSTATATWSKDR